MPTVKIKYDHNSESPATAFDNLGTMLCAHGKYKLGNEDAHDDLIQAIRGSKYYNESMEDEIHDIVEVMDIALNCKDVIATVLPLYLYDHGGITISTTPFSCPWDSGQVGYIFITKEKVYQEYSVKRISKKLINQLDNALRSEVELYDEYIRGNVYGFEILDEEGDVLDSCYGFYGSDIEKNGILEYIPEELHEQAKESFDNCLY